MLLLKFDGVEGEVAWEPVCYSMSVQSSFYKVRRGHE
jgi:hypothetical protein